MGKMTPKTDGVGNPTVKKAIRVARAKTLNRKMEMSATKKPVVPAPRATKRGTPVAMPTKPGNIASGIKKTARPLPTGKATKKPMTEAQRQADALDKLMKKRLAEAKKTGVYPNYRTN
jgi:hypothetical protein